jgi:hypothetical protein
VLGVPGACCPRFRVWEAPHLVVPPRAYHIMEGFVGGATRRRYGDAGARFRC